MADHLQNRFSLSEVALVSGDRSEFSIWVGEVCVAQKDHDDYPSLEAVVAAVARHLA